MSRNYNSLVSWVDQEFEHNTSLMLLGVENKKSHWQWVSKVLLMKPEGQTLYMVPISLFDKRNALEFMIPNVVSSECEKISMKIWS